MKNQVITDKSVNGGKPCENKDTGAIETTVAGKWYYRLCDNQTGWWAQEHWVGGYDTQKEAMKAGRTYRDNLRDL